MVDKPGTSRTLQRKVQALAALVRRPTIVASHSLVLLDPIFDVLEDFTIDLSRSTGRDGPVYDR